jgi:hypothetical protein
MRRPGRQDDLVGNALISAWNLAFFQGGDVFRQHFILNHDENAIAGDGRFNTAEADAIAQSKPEPQCPVALTIISRW